jgi:hypothetical protein
MFYERQQAAVRRCWVDTVARVANGGGGRVLSFSLIQSPPHKSFFQTKIQPVFGCFNQSVATC